MCVEDKIQRVCESENLVGPLAAETPLGWRRGLSQEESVSHKGLEGAGCFTDHQGGQGARGGDGDGD